MTAPGAAGTEASRAHAWRAPLYFVLLVVHMFSKGIARTWRRASLRAAGVRVAATATLTTGTGAELTLAPGVSIGAGTLLVVSAEGGGASSARLVIERDTAINEYCNLRASGAPILIGAGCLLAQYVCVISSNHGTDAGRPIHEQPWDLRRSGVAIGDGVWIGAHAVVLPGVSIGNGAVVAAGAVVTKDIPPMEIWAGVPARRLSVRTATDRATRPMACAAAPAVGSASRC